MWLSHSLPHLSSECGLSLDVDASGFERSGSGKAKARKNIKPAIIEPGKD